MVFVASTLLMSTRGQIIDPLTGRDVELEKMLRLSAASMNNSSVNPIKDLIYRWNPPTNKRNDETEAASEYYLPDGKTPVYKFFNKNPYGK